ncbi:MAG: Serine/threonine-protein kinase PknD [Xanthomonadales bacterium]|nr:Serine/threonine-protein kinase PknD [Xanthomonadales bacterium]
MCAGSDSVAVRCLQPLASPCACVLVGIALCFGAALTAWALPSERRDTSLIRQGGDELGGWPRNLSVTVLAADASGRIWLGTPRGVHRFDGARLQEVGDWNVADSAIADLEVTAARRVFALTTEGTLLEWSTGAWQVRSHGLPLRELALDVDGGLVVAGGRTVLKLSPKDELDVHPALVGLSGWALDLKLRHGRLWLLWGPSPDRLQVHSVGEDGGLQRDALFDFAPQPREVRRFDIDAGGSRAIWAGGLRVRLPNGELEAPQIVPDGESAEYVRQLWFDRDGVLNVCGAKPVALTRWFPGASVDSIGKHLPHPTCFGVLEDPAGALWVATYRGPMRLSVGPVWQQWLNPGDESNGQAYALAAARDGGYWVGAANGVHRFAASGVREKSWKPAAMVRAIAETTTGDVYAGAGTSLLRLEDGVWSLLTGAPDDAVIASLCADPDGALWVVRDDAIERRVAGAVQSRIPFAAASMMIVTRDGRRLVAADALYELLHSEHKGWSLQALARPDSPAVRVRSAFEAPDGAIWAATTGEGIWRWDAAGLIKFGTKDGLPTNRYEWVVVSGRGSDALVYAAPRVASIFAGGSLLVFPGQSLNSRPRVIPWRQIDRQDGIIRSPLSSDVQPAANVDSEGRVWVAAAEGLAIVAPRSWHDWSRIDPPEMEVWQHGRRLVAKIAGKFELARDDPVVLDVGARQLPDPRLALWYRIDALPWQRAPSPASLEILALAPGLHAVALQFRRDEGLYGAVRTLRLEIPTRWYERQSAVLALGLLALLGLLLAALAWRRLLVVRRELYADLGQELAWLGRFQTLVLACVVQRIADDPPTVARALRSLMDSVDAIHWASAALAELEQRGLIRTAVDGRFFAARKGLDQLPLGNRPLAELLRDGARRVEQYILIDQLGSGGQADVWRAVDARTRQVVALKLLRGEHLMSASMRERLKREADVLSRLRHPGVVRLLRVCEVGSEKFIAMELVAGRSLAKVLEERRVLPPAEAKCFLRRLRCAVEALHAEGVVHRDLDPTNIMIRATGEPVLIDFGLALGPQHGDRVTAPYDHVGKPAYSAPERIVQDCAHNPDGPEVDWWAFGVIAHEVLLGLSPFQVDGLAPTDLALAFLHPDGPARRPFPEGFPREWRRLIDSCLARDPSERRPDFGLFDAEELP